MVMDALDATAKEFNLKDFELSKEQEETLDRYIAKWKTVGRSTDRIDFESAKEAVKMAYRCVGLEPPQHILYAKGPREAAQMIHDISVELNKTDPTQEIFEKKDTMQSCVWGNHEWNWLAFYEFFLEEIEFPGIESVRGLIEVGKTCGWVNCYDTHAIIHDRPLILKLDDNDRWHNEIGPTFEFADGLKMYAWRNQDVPESWIERKTHVLEDGTEIPLSSHVFKIENNELQRCAIEICGWNDIIKDLNLTKIQEDEYGTLVGGDIPALGGYSRFVQVRCPAGGGRDFALAVHPSTKSALEGVAASYGISAEEYRMLEGRT